MSLQLLVIYSVFSFFYIISPGPAILLAISNGMTTGMRSVLLSTVGNITGLLLLSTASISGLGVILTSSATLFLIVKTIGALYLIYLGVRQFMKGKVLLLPETSKGEQRARSSRSLFLEGFFLAATNPKAILFFLALFPQFLDLQKPLLPQFAVLTALFMALSFLSLISYGFLGKSARGFFKNQTVMMWFHRITGGVFISMGIGLMQLKSAQT